MNILRRLMVPGIFASGIICIATGCANVDLHQTIGNPGDYNYSPSIIEKGQRRDIWWCSPGVNPQDHSQDTDAIYYESLNTVTLEKHGPKLVLAETPGAWDSAFLCNPKVVRGIFHNPLSDGVDYTYALYYVATADPRGINNSIGVAFSNDGIHWKKYPDPVIRSTTETGYGVGQPALYNSDGKSAITMFYEDSAPVMHHVAAQSTDGIHFISLGTLTMKGINSDNPDPTWGDMSYDSAKEEWYAVFDTGLRPAETTSGTQERGQFGAELYKIPADALLSGSSPWQLVATFDTNSTGYESNFIPGFVHDEYGTLNLAGYPAIQMYTSVSYPQPAWDATPLQAANSATPDKWMLTPMEWSPTMGSLLPLRQYVNAQVHEDTTGWISPAGGFRQVGILGYLYRVPTQSATLPLYACKRDDKDYFVSLDSGCEGQRLLGKQGYAYSKITPGKTLIPIYRCSTGHDHFISTDAQCGGSTTDEFLAYIHP